MSMRWCTGCHALRSTQSFTSGKTCTRHNYKRKLNQPPVQRWDDFLRDLSQWSGCDGELHEFEMSVTLNSLEESIGREVSGHEHHDLKKCEIDDLEKLIFGASGFRWTRNNHKVNYHRLICRQSLEADKNLSRDVILRNRERRKREDCKGMVSLQLDAKAGTVLIHYRHVSHIPFEDNSVSDEVRAFIIERAGRTPAGAIFRELQQKLEEVSGSYLATRRQVYAIWQKESELTWRCDSDPLTSSTILLEKANYKPRQYRQDNLYGISFIVESILEIATSYSAKVGRLELAMDSTFGTNSAGMELFGVFAEIDGGGFPIAFFLLGHHDKTQAQGQPMSKTAMLVDFLTTLKEQGVTPTSYGTDKDLAELAAVEIVWPDVKHQLCLWHAKRALRSKFDSGRATALQPAFRSEDAEGFITTLNVDHCWAMKTLSKAREHRNKHCQCPSRDVSYGNDSTGIKAANVQAAFIDLFIKHFNHHPTIPNDQNEYLNAEEIYRRDVTEMYETCRSKNLPHLWSYLWAEWYQPKIWRKWARASAPQVPLLRTTMVAEGSWRKLKHDDLQPFGRGRIDLMLHVITGQYLPELKKNLFLWREGKVRHFQMHWRKDFRREWTACEEKAKRLVSISSDMRVAYAATVSKWTCNCRHFQASRFLICKHLVALIHPIQSRWLFFQTVERRCQAPFVIDRQIISLTSAMPDRPPHRLDSTSILHPRASASPINNVQGSLDDSSDTEASDDASEVIGSDDDVPNIVIPHVGAVLEPPPDQEEIWIANEQNGEQAMNEYFTTLRGLICFGEQQMAKGNKQWFIKVRETRLWNSVRTGMESVKQFNNYRIMRKTWDLRDKLALLFAR